MLNVPLQQGGEQRRRRPRWTDYLVVLVAETALTAGLLLMYSAFPLGKFPIAYVLLTMLVAHFFGEGPAIFSVALGWYGYTYWASPPMGFVWPPASSFEEWAGQVALILGLTLVAAAALQARKSNRSIQLLADQALSLNASLNEKIEERKQTEIALRESEERLGFALATIHTGAWDLDLVDGTAYRSIDHDCIFGYQEPLPEWTYQMFLEHVLPEDRQEVDAKFQHAIKTQGDWNFECRIRRADGEVCWILAAGRHRPDATGAVRRMAGIVQDITDRKLAEEALRESEERFRALYEQAAVGIELVELDRGKMLGGNRVLARMLGYTEEELETRTFAEITHPDDLPGEEALLRRLLDGEIPNYSFEKRYIHKDGYTVWVRVTSSLARTAQPYRMSIVEDISQQKRAEETARESEARFRTMVDAIPQLAWMAQPDGYIFWYNQRWYEYTGTTPEMMEGWGWQSVHDPELLPKVLERWKGSIATGEPFDMEFPLKGADGEFRWFLTRVRPLKDSEGRVMRWFGTNTDISEKREAEEAIRLLNADLERRVAERTSQLEDTVGRLNVAYEQEQAARAGASASEARVRQFLEMAPDGIVIVTESGCITFANNQAGAMFGYKPEELEGKQVEDLLPERYRDVHLGHRADYAAEPRTRAMGIGLDLFGLHADGSEFPVEISLSPNRTDGDLTVTAIVRDITMRRLAEERIKALNEELTRRATDLEAANKELEAFSYSVSHDLRAPLRAVDGFSNTLLKNYRASLDERGQDYLQRVRAAAQKMGQLIDDILGLSRATRAEMHREPVNLSAMATEIIGELRNSQPERKAKISIEPDMAVNADPSLLRIALNNLIGNAWKFTSTRDTACIEVGSIVQDGERVYFVKDNGVGFSPTYADKLFSPFQRLHSEGEFPGTGIGLALVQRIIRRHGGRIWADSVEDQGATFYFTLGEATK